MLNFLRHAFNGNNFQDILMGRFCTKANLSTMIMDHKTPNNFLTQPFLMVLIGASIVLGLTYYTFFSAIKQRSHFDHDVSNLFFN